ncbi:MAG TPA: nucleoside-diphosphate kinase [Alphaproteobacteria bacterium]|nr:nucleoside-diphosphate kinase [Alphaproteobacteria bacterium]
MSEQTLAIIKPDAVSRGLTGKILARLEEHGFKVRGLKLVHLSKGAAQAFYQVHAQRPFYDSLTSYMSSGPIVPILLERDNAIQTLRDLMGATDPRQAAPGTIRREYGENIERNAIHGSDAPETAAVEIPFFFNRLELV